jgi:hypothetical protein
MSEARYLRTEDRLPPGVVAPGGRVDPAPMLGTWYATDKAATGIVRMELSDRDGTFVLRAFGAGDPEPVDWGEVEATAYAASVASPEGMAVSAVYDFGFLETILAAYTKGGILVLDTFNTFKDSSGRSAYFSREFFHR